MKGFTLIETIISILVFTIVIASISVFIFTIYQNYYTGYRKSRAINEAKEGIERTVQEIRMAGIGEDGAYPIEKADDFQLIIYSDIDRDGKRERVNYFLDGIELKKGIIEPEGVPAVYPSDKEHYFIVANYLRNSADLPIFEYYDENMNLLEPSQRRKSTRLIKITLKVDTSLEKPPPPIIISSKAQLRNIYSNL